MKGFGKLKKLATDASDKAVGAVGGAVDKAGGGLRTSLGGTESAKIQVRATGCMSCEHGCEAAALTPRGWLQSLRELFDRVDDDGSGTLDRDELNVCEIIACGSHIEYTSFRAKLQRVCARVGVCRCWRPSWG